MKKSKIPFNIELLKLTQQQLNLLRPVTVLDSKDGMTDSFHADGLFSTEIFGRLGSKDRSKRFSYIDISVSVFHPLVFKILYRLKGFYKDIMAGTQYAYFDENEKDFVKSDIISGETGFYFFLKHWEKIEFKQTGSDRRSLNITFIEKFKEKALNNKIVVIPAGMREMEIDSKGRAEEDEINAIYRSIIAAANSIRVSGEATNTPILDNVRWKIQLKFNELFEYLDNMLEGKGGFIQKKWASRGIFNGTRNVLTAMYPVSEDLDDKYGVNFDSTVVGMYQLSKMVLPKTIHFILNGWLKEVFVGDSGKAYLTDKKTFERRIVDVNHESISRWTTPEGLEKVITLLKDPDIRNKHVIIEGNYLGLVYRGPDMTFKVFGDISELPKHLDKKHVHPLTYIELIYLSGYKLWNTFPAFVTRYPIADLGSIYNSRVHLNTTVVSERRTELDFNWEPIPDAIAPVYPILNGISYVDSASPHPTRLANLGADFDGDTGSFNGLYTDNSIAEYERLRTKRTTWIDPRGGFRASISNNTMTLVLRALTRRTA